MRYQAPLQHLPVGAKAKDSARVGPESDSRQLVVYARDFPYLLVLLLNNDEDQGNGAVGWARGAAGNEQRLAKPISI